MEGFFFFFFPKKMAHLVTETDISEICIVGRLEASGSMDLIVMRQNSFFIRASQSFLIRPSADLRP